MFCCKLKFVQVWAKTDVAPEQKKQYAKYKKCTEIKFMKLTTNKGCDSAIQCANICRVTSCLIIISIIIIIIKDTAFKELTYIIQFDLLFQPH